MCDVPNAERAGVRFDSHLGPFLPSPITCYRGLDRVLASLLVRPTCGELVQPCAACAVIAPSRIRASAAADGLSVCLLSASQIFRASAFLLAAM